jgi:hypothetical protein
MNLFTPNIIEYIQSSAKNKIIFHSEHFGDINYIDIGFEFSKKIHLHRNSDKIALFANSIIEDILNERTFFNSNFGKCLFIENLGILLEPELKLNLTMLLDKHSKNTPLFIKWDGEIEEGCLFFLTREKGIKININELSHITI